MLARPAGAITGFVMLLLSAVVLLCPAVSSSATTVRPINNDCSAGTVAFTFDDGPGPSTPVLLNTLKNLNMKATFFLLGNKVGGAPDVVRAEAAGGFTIGNHSWDHQSFNGVSTNTQPMTDQQVTDELENTSNAIVAAGVAKPTLYRPPYGDINSYYDLLAQHLGYRIVMPWGANIIDSSDWSGITAAQIADRVINGYTQNGVTKPGIKADTIVAMHDGDDPEAVNTIDSLQAIVDAMNTKHLCSTATPRADATGGAVPPPPPNPPASGNLVSNPSLEALRLNNTPASEPVCFQQAGASVANSTAVWSQTSDAHSGAVAERVDVSRWNGGDRKLVLTQRQSEQACLAGVTPGATYSMWVNYKGNWPYVGASPTKVSIATYYRINGNWSYWQGSALFPPTSSWNLAYFSTGPVPAGATAISWGLAISGVGSLTTDDYTMVQN